MISVNVDVSLNDFDTSEIIKHLEELYNKGTIEEIRQIKVFANQIANLDLSKLTLNQKIKLDKFIKEL